MEETLNTIGLTHGTDKATYHKYLDFYQKHLPGRDFSGTIVELGCWDMASVRMWRQYYPLANIVGVDIQLRVREIEGVKLIEANSMDIEALKEIGPIDICIDDAGHDCLSQQVAFNWIFNHQLTPGGLYVMEDAQTSFMLKYQNTKYTTYELLSGYPGVKVYNGNEAGSISIIVPKT